MPRYDMSAIIISAHLKAILIHRCNVNCSKRNNVYVLQSKTHPTSTNWRVQNVEASHMIISINNRDLVDYL